MLEFIGTVAIVALALWVVSRVAQYFSLQAHIAQTNNVIAMIDMYAIGKGISGDTPTADRVSVFAQMLKDGTSSVVSGRLLYPEDALTQIEAFDKLINDPHGILIFIGKEKYTEAARSVISMRKVRNQLWRLAGCG